MSLHLRWLVVGALLSSSGALAQGVSDGPTCDRLISLNHAGVYIAYPQPMAEPKLLLARGSMPYDPNARFFYVPGFGPRLTISRDEGVWHVRTRTRSEKPQGTDTALVYRPGVTTRCSPNSFLEAFDENGRFVALRGYENYHAERPSRNLSTALPTYFHFKIKDRLSVETDGCTRTDDRIAFPGFSKIYSFQVQADSQVAGNLAPIGTAVADPSNPSRGIVSKYDGLSSEFAYDSSERRRPACFGFTIPLPTNGFSRRLGWGGSSLVDARLAGQSWRPVSTEIFIKRLRGRSVLQVVSMNVGWSR